MSIANILNNEINELDRDTASVNQTLIDLIVQVNGSVNLIKSITDRHGKNAILANMTESEQAIFNLVWGKIELSVEGTDYVLPLLVDEVE